jgi:integrase
MIIYDADVVLLDIDMPSSATSKRSSRSGRLRSRPRSSWGSGIEDGIWRLCKTYGRLIGVPELKPHDLRHGVAMEVLQQHHDLEQVRALLGHTRVDTTQIYATIRPVQLKRAVAFYEDKASRMLGG